MASDLSKPATRQTTEVASSSTTHSTSPWASADTPAQASAATKLGSSFTSPQPITFERAAFLASWREKKLRGVLLAAQGAGGNAATRIEGVATKGGLYAAGVIPEVEDLFQRQARELDRKKREELLHQIQRILHERVVFAPIWDNGFIRGVGARVDEPSLTLIPAFPYSAPLEDLRLKRP